ncbi:hypothetical protein [Blastopirellula marina]|uniref:Uncharacterized protein n=1 Tax=Blastopirellula marina DSM 3645 TaxID=314230 RepID=A3ZPU3_9BACT|nr:hypothetical protein [Blastopirellula marina]EAQ81216.1 hypothetical protein DSM3645_22531 [Blastopirellula marina DSM 3645]
MLAILARDSWDATGIGCRRRVAHVERQVEKLAQQSEPVAGLTLVVGTIKNQILA